MNSFYSDEELKQIGFKYVGDENVLISRKASLYGVTEISICNNVRIDDFCIISGKITIGNYVHIAAHSALYGGKCGITIDDFANISSRVSIYGINDDYSGETMTNPMVMERCKKLKSAPVYIGKHVIVGSTSVILPGVSLQTGSAFGSFSLIKNSSEPWSINVGVPAKKIKDRSKDLLKYENRFYNEKDAGDIVEDI
ncbi:hypothetical protein AALB47_09555 [Lachnospiraceae bacterium 54-11]